MNNQNAWVGTQDWSSMAAPHVNPVTVHNCGTTMEKLKLPNKNCPPGQVKGDLQEWCNPAVERYRWGSKIIESPQEYYRNIRNWVVGKRQQDIQRMRTEMPQLTTGKWFPTSDNLGSNKRLATIVADGQQMLMDYLNVKFAESCKEIPMFFKNNPLPESLTITDMQVVTYQSENNPMNLYHKAIVTVWNTKRYVSLTFKVGAYQSLRQKKTWAVVWDFLNDNACPIGQSIKDNMCGEPAPYDLTSGHLENQPEAEKLKWINPPALTNDTYTKGGFYSRQGNVRITDNGPQDLDNLIKEMRDTLSKNNYQTAEKGYNGGEVF